MSAKRDGPTQWDAAPDVLRPSEAAALLAVDVSTVYEHVRAGELPAVLLGTRTMRLLKTDLQAWVARHRTERGIAQ